jgi:glycosyltransferase involved in cell wall biosynthesis
MNNSPRALMPPRPSLEAATPAARATPPVVLFVHGSAEMYGSDKVLLNLAQSLVAGGEFTPVVVLHEDGLLRAALQAAGVEVHVGAVVKIAREMFTPQAVPGLLRTARQCLRDLDAAVAGRTVALVHSNTLAVLGGALWAWRRQQRHLWHVHEIILKPALVSRGLPWLAERLSQRVVSNSSPTQAWLLARAPRLAGRAAVVFNGLPAVQAADPAAQAAAAAFRLRIGAQPGDVVATVAGRLNHWKGQGLLIAALGLLKRQGRLGALRLAVVGDVYAGQDSIRQALVAQVAALGLNDRVAFVPFLSDIYPVWRASQVAVVPSTQPEPFGMVAIEAMACGLPVLAAGHGGLLDIVLPEQTGLLFEPGNAAALAEALARLAADPALRARLGAAGAQRQREVFSMDRQAEHTRAVYRELVAA